MIGRRMAWSATLAACLMGTALLGTATGAQAQPHSRPRPATRKVKVINLHAAFAARLGHAKPGEIAGIMYPRGKRSTAPGKRKAERRDGPESRTAAGGNVAGRRGSGTAAGVAESCSEPDCPLVYNGGLIQQSPHVYLLLWGPGWSSDPSQAATASYLESFYAGLGVQPEDTWSRITSQYGDGSGFPAFTGSVYEGAFQDTSTPPSGVTQAQLAAEADAFASAQSITDLNDAQVVVATQSGTCPQGFYAPGCAGGTGTYCAWHSSSNLPYTNLPYVLDAGTGCGEDFVNSGGTDDGFSIVGGHEYAESITDPFPDTGWMDTSDAISGGEVADKCAWRGEAWGGNDPAGDVTLSTGSFAMQSLWSDAADACVMSAPGADTVSVTNPGRQSGTVGNRVSLQMRGSSTGGSSLTWTASGLPTGLSIGSATGLISGTLTRHGGYDVTVTATDQAGATGSASFAWTIKAKPVAGRPITGYAGKCLDDQNGNTADGGKAEAGISTCTGSGAERWTFTGGTLKVLGKCLTDPRAGGAGTGLVITACGGARANLWTHLANGEYVLTRNGLCLTDPRSSTVNGTQAEIRGCRNLRNQRWSGP
jgi:hypothetical protein